MEHRKTITKYLSREGDTPTGGKSPERTEGKYRVSTVVPLTWKPLIKKLVEKYGYNSIHEWLRDLIREALTKEGLLG